MSWQPHDRCHIASFVMYSPDAKFEEQRFNISRDFLIECCAALLKLPVTSSLNAQKRKYL